MSGEATRREESLIWQIKFISFVVVFFSRMASLLLFFFLKEHNEMQPAAFDDRVLLWSDLRAQATREQVGIFCASHRPAWNDGSLGWCIIFVNGWSGGDTLNAILRCIVVYMKI